MKDETPGPLPGQLPLFCLPCAMGDTCTEHDPTPERDLHEAAVELVSRATEGRMTRDEAQRVRADARAVVEAADKVAPPAPVSGATETTIIEAPEPRPGVKPARLNAYLTAKEQAPRAAIPSDLLALAEFLAAIDEEPEKEDEEDGEELVSFDDFEDDRAVEEGAEEDAAGFEPVTGRDAWPTVVL